MSRVYIYGLCGPARNARVMYVGRTAKDPKRRLAEHLADARTCSDWNPLLSRWIRRLVASGHHPSVRVLRVTGPEMASAAEMEAIACCASENAPRDTFNRNGLAGAAKVPVTSKIQGPLARKLERTAKRLKLSRSALIEQAVRELCERLA